MTFREISYSFVGLTVGLALLWCVACGDQPRPEPSPTSAPVLPTNTPGPVVAPTPSAPDMQTPVLGPTSTPTRTPTPAVVVTETPIVATSRPVPTVRPTPDPRSRGGTLNLASAQNIAHQDVHQDVSPALSSWGPGIAYSRLMRLETGPDTPLPGLSLECDICSDWTMESPTSYLFNLRDDIKWHNLDPVGGRAIDAEDVIFSYQRQINPDFPNSPLLRSIAALEYLGPLTLRVRFDLPDADSLLSLADGHSKIVAPETLILSGDLREGPTIGTGPWILERTSVDESHSFSSHADYFEPGLPLVDNLRILILTNKDTRSAAFQTGMTDVHEMSPMEWIRHLQQSPNSPSLEIPQPGRGIEVAFKTSGPPFDDVRARKAAMLSMDPVGLIEEQWEGFGFVGTGFPVASPDWLLPKSELAGRFDDTDSAQSLLLAAGLAYKTPVTITVGDFGQPYLDYADAVSEGMQSVGFDSQVEVVNRRQFGENVWLQGDYQMMIGPPAPVSTPNGFLLPVFHSEGVWNTTGHRDDALDAMLEAQAVEHDAEKRAELIHSIQNHILDQGYRFMPFTRMGIWTWQPRVRDFDPNFSLFEYHHWTKVWLEE